MCVVGRDGGVAAQCSPQPTAPRGPPSIQEPSSRHPNQALWNLTPRAASADPQPRPLVTLPFRRSAALGVQRLTEPMTCCIAVRLDSPRPDVPFPPVDHTIVLREPIAHPRDTPIQPRVPIHNIQRFHSVDPQVASPTSWSGRLYLSTQL